MSTATSPFKILLFIVSDIITWAKDNHKTHILGINPLYLLKRSRPMKRIAIFAAIILCLCSCIKEKTNRQELTPGDTIPQFEVTMADGSIVSPQSLYGSPSCIVFFHTSCPDCRQTLPKVQEIYDLYINKGIKFVLISREQGKEEIQEYWQENNMTMPYSPQTSREVYSLFAQSRIPRIYISDKDCIIREIFTDDPLPTFEGIKAALNSIIEKSI